MTDKPSFRLSFKKEKTDAWSPDQTTIKANKKQIGLIDSGTSDKGRIWKIRLAVKNDIPDHPCPFKWITLKATLSTETEARDFLKEHWEKIREKYQIHQFED